MEGIISCFNGRGCFSDEGGGASFLSGGGGTPWGSISFDWGGFSKKIVGWRGGGQPTMGNPDIPDKNGKSQHQNSLLEI